MSPALLLLLLFACAQWITENAPERLSEVESLLAAHAGRETALLALLIAGDGGAAAAAATSADDKPRVDQGVTSS